MIILSRGVPSFLPRHLKQAYLDLGYSLKDMRSTSFQDIYKILVDRGVAQWEDEVNNTKYYKKSTAKTPPPPSNANVNVKQTDAHRSETLRQQHVSSPDDLTGTTGDKSQGRKHSTKSIKEKEKLKRRAEAVHENNKSSIDIAKDKAQVNKNLKSNNAKSRTKNAPKSTSKDHIKRNINRDVTRKATKTGTTRKEHLERPIKSMEKSAKNVIDSAKLRRQTRKIYTEGASVGKNLIDKSKSTFSKFYSTKRGKIATYIGLGIIAMNFFRGAVNNRLVNPNQNAIPDEYERGYDIIKANTTDFGSPVNLQKTAAHTITPYKSSIRRANIRTTGSITKSNIALRSHSNAIKHTQY